MHTAPGFSMVIRQLVSYARAWYLYVCALSFNHFCIKETSAIGGYWLLIPFALVKYANVLVASNMLTR